MKYFVVLVACQCRRRISRTVSEFLAVTVVSFNQIIIISASCCVCLTLSCDVVRYIGVGGKEKGILSPLNQRLSETRSAWTDADVHCP